MMPVASTIAPPIAAAAAIASGRRSAGSFTISATPTHTANQIAVVGCTAPAIATAPSDRRPPRPHHRDEREHADREGELPRMEMAFERIGAGLRDAMTQRRAANTSAATVHPLA